MATVGEIFATFDAAGSQSERGTKFEELMVDYFRLDPTLAARYTKVSRWGDWQHRGTSPDVGIDLVAQDRETGDWTAIQCKFYAPNHYMAKEDIDSFFTASGKKWDGVAFANRIIISTTDKWSSHAESALENQTIPVQSPSRRGESLRPCLNSHWATKRALGHGQTGAAYHFAQVVGRPSPLELSEAYSPNLGLVVALSLLQKVD